MEPHELKAALPRTWGAFFGRHGNFTPAQLVGIPPLLEGENLLISAPTAGGKTESAIAPLIERHLPPASATAPTELTILYLLPTRALINDLWTRLSAPLQHLRISYAVKTYDFSTFDPERPSHLLLTTPESLDALFTRHAKVLAGVRAVVIDELHNFDGTVRGDQLRVLLSRLRQVRAHAVRMGDAASDTVQYVALSASIAQPEKVVGRYFSPARVALVPGGRPVQAEQLALDKESPGALLDYLGTFRRRGWRKALVFCNTRAEIESYAAAVRAGGSPFGDAVYVHYSNLEWERRREIELGFSKAGAAICFASSTLELGIDIGNIDVTLLIGPPGSWEVFVQRAGRANRRHKSARVACFYRTPLEHLLFGGLLNALDVQDRPTPAPTFRPSVCIQQIFSLLAQSPTGAVRLKPLSELFDGMLAAADIKAILGNLQALGYLKSGRAGEWLAGERLNQLIDLQLSERNPLSLHSNLAVSGMAQIKIRDRYSQRIVATVDREWFDRDILTLEGRTLNVEWYDGESLWVSAYRGEKPTSRGRYLSTRQLLSYELAQQLPAQVGLSPTIAPLVSQGDSQLWFHWLGDVYGRAILDLLGYTLAVDQTPQPGLCLLLRDPPRTMPSLTLEQIRRYLRDHYRRYESLMSLGAYHHLLPVELRRRAVTEQFDIPRFTEALEALQVESAPESLTQELTGLVG